MDKATANKKLGSLIAQWDEEDEEGASEPVSVPRKPKSRESPLSLLQGLSITGSSQKMRLKMLNDEFVMKDIAILGQWTTIYAAPNTGKTLLALWLLREQIKAKLIEGKNVFYVNADDTYRGAVEKTEMAEECGMGMVVPNHNEFQVNQIPLFMTRLAEEDEAKGVVIVLDTLKKFTDLMDKRVGTAFGVKARSFVSAGGTLICLAHTNKHRDVDGKGVYSGTSDIVDDSDCVYIVDKISSEGVDSSQAHTVEFVNKKARGDVSTTQGFSYKRVNGQTYAELMESVTRVGSHDIAGSRQQVQVEKGLEEDADIISAIQDCIKSGIITKAKITSEAKERTAESHARVRKVLEKRTGREYALGDRWVSRPGDHNAHVYSVLPTLSKSI